MELDDAFPCQHYENCGGYCETLREQEFALCENCLGQHDEDLAEDLMIKPNKHAKLTKECADGYKIQCMGADGKWRDLDPPGVVRDLESRIKRYRITHS